jgi:hypothetical protein
VIKSGSLKLTLQKYDSSTSSWVDATSAPIFNYSYWEPGYTQVVNLKLRNTGDLSLKWKSAITSTGVNFADTTAENTKLADAIIVYVREGATESETVGYLSTVGRFDFEAKYAANEVKKYTLRDFINTYMPNGTLAASGGETYIGIVLQMPTDVDNDYQNKVLGSTFDFTVVATQNTVETDSYDNQYDAGATY